MDKAPKVFISYSHDSASHKQWVAALAVKLRQSGVDAVLDQWDLFPGEDIPRFMEKQLSDCDYALLICTKRYVEKANSGEGGVGYEKMIVSSEMIQKMDIGKFVPLIRQAGTHEVPIFIKTKLFIDFSEDEEFEVVFDELLRTIFRSALQTKPPLGNPPKINSTRVAPSTNQPSLPEHSRKVLKRMVLQYDRENKSWWKVGELMTSCNMGRLAVENGLGSLKAIGLVSNDRDGDWILTTEGKSFAVSQGLINL